MGGGLVHVRNLGELQSANIKLLFCLGWFGDTSYGLMEPLNQSSLACAGSLGCVGGSTKANLVPSLKSVEPSIRANEVGFWLEFR